MASIISFSIVYSTSSNALPGDFLVLMRYRNVLTYLLTYLLYISVSAHWRKLWLQTRLLYTNHLRLQSSPGFKSYSFVLELNSVVYHQIPYRHTTPWTMNMTDHITSHHTWPNATSSIRRCMSDYKWNVKHKLENAPRTRTFAKRRRHSIRKQTINILLIHSPFCNYHSCGHM